MIMVKLIKKRNLLLIIEFLSEIKILSDTHLKKNKMLRDLIGLVTAKKFFDSIKRFIK